MKYKLVTDGELFAVERSEWFMPLKKYRNLKYGDYWCAIGDRDIEDCWGTKEEAEKALKWVNRKRFIKEVKQ